MQYLRICQKGKNAILKNNIYSINVLINVRVKEKYYSIEDIFIIFTSFYKWNMEDPINQPLLNNKDEEVDINIKKEIDDKLQSGFVVKVYSILIYQLSICGVLIILSIYTEWYKNFTIQYPSSLYFAIIPCFIIALLPCCVP